MRTETLAPEDLRSAGRGSSPARVWLAALAALVVLALEHIAIAQPACTARMRSAFHLRPRAVARTSGPELPAGTEVAVLASSGVQRYDRYRGRGRAPVLSRIRVLSRGAEGFTFVDPRDLAPSCPLLGAIGTRAQPLRERIGHDWRENYGREWDYVPMPPQRLTRWWLPFDPARDSVLARFDVDHNGSQETLIRAHPDDGIPGAIVLMREGVRGAPGIIVDREQDHDHHQNRYHSIVRAGAETYVVMESQGACCLACVNVVCGEGSWRLYRLHPDGWFVETLVLPTESEGEALAFRGEPDGNITVEGALTHRRQTLRFNTATFSFAVEGPTMPGGELDERWWQ